MQYDGQGKNMLRWNNGREDKKVHKECVYMQNVHRVEFSEMLGC